eukprot:2584754-Rhodomonas_salina.1
MGVDVCKQASKQARKKGSCCSGFPAAANRGGCIVIASEAATGARVWCWEGAHSWSSLREGRRRTQTLGAR